MKSTSTRHSYDTRHKLLRVLLYLFVILVVLVTLYPYFVMFTTAAKSRAEIYSPEGTLLPITWLWQNFKDIWTLAPLSRYFLNSIIVAGGSTLIAIVCGIPAAYALARMKFKGKNFFLGLVIISQMFAPVVLLVGIYKVMNTFGMTDSLVGLVFINAAFNQAFAIWLLRGTFMSIISLFAKAPARYLTDTRPGLFSVCISFYLYLLTIFCISGSFFSISLTSLSCVLQRSRLCPSLWILK